MFRKTERQTGRQAERQKDRKTERQKDRKTERHKDRKTERQKRRKTERQKDRKTERQVEFVRTKFAKNCTCVNFVDVLCYDAKNRVKQKCLNFFLLFIGQFLFVTN